MYKILLIPNPHPPKGSSLDNTTSLNFFLSNLYSSRGISVVNRVSVTLEKFLLKIVLSIFTLYPSHKQYIKLI